MKIQRGEKRSPKLPFVYQREEKQSVLLGKDKHETSSSSASAKTIKIELKVKGTKPNFLYPTKSDHRQYLSCLHNLKSHFGRSFNCYRFYRRHKIMNYTKAINDRYSII